MAKRNSGKKSLFKPATRVKQLWDQAERLAAAGKSAEEEIALRSILDLAPDHFGSLIKLSYMALGAGKKPIALDYAKRAVQVNYGDAQGHLILGKVLAGLGLTDLAEAELAIAEQLNPEDARILDSLGWVLAQQGRSAEAEAVYHRAIALTPNEVDAYFGLSVNKIFQPGDPDIALIEKLRDQESRYSQREKIYLHFVLAKMYHDCSEYDRAFAEMQKGNDMKRRQVQYSSELQQQAVTQIMQTMDADFVRRLEGAGHTEDGPVFILGMPRSGTTLVESLLSRHSQVSSIGEVSYIHNLAQGCGQRLGSQMSYPQFLSELTPQLCQSSGEQYVQLTRQFGIDATYVVDKTPGNFILVGFILALLPNARIIHCVRNPVDTCLSIYQQFFTSSMGYSYEQKEIGEYFVQYRRLMTHWENLFPNKMLLVAYEDVVADSEKSLRRMVDYCGLSWDERRLTAPDENIKIRTASAWQARQPVYQSSVQRWRQYEKHLAPLLEALQPVLADGSS